MLMMIAEETETETVAAAQKRITERVAAQISGALFAIDPLKHGDGKAGFTYDSAGRVLASDVKTTDDLREYLESWGMLEALPVLSHLLGTFGRGEKPWQG